MARSGAWAAVGAAAVLALGGCELVAGITDRHVDPSGSGASGGAGSGASASTGGGSSAISAGGSGGGGSAASSGTGGSSALGAWPDSPTVFCSDTVSQVDPCPPSTDVTYGQDGNVREHEPTYTQGTDGIVVDSVTKLMWIPHAISVTTADIGPKCAARSDGGFHDWRGPTTLELSSLLDYGTMHPAIDAAVFSLGSGFAWSIDTLTEAPLKAWGIDFDLGDVQPRQKSTGGGVALCVRGSLPAGGLTPIDAELWSDPRTGLTWETHTPKSMYIDWSDALLWCAMLSVGGHDDFRLPSTKEALTLVDRDVDYPYIVPELKQKTTLDPYWTSTPRTDSPDRARSVVYYTGYTSQASMADIQYNVRCVRTTAD